VLRDLRGQRTTPVRWRRACIAFALAVSISALPIDNPYAGEPVAVVEAISAKGAGLQRMDFVEAGRVIELGFGESLILGYLASCIQERIVGGSVRIGIEQSAVQGGDVKRDRVECDGGSFQSDSDTGGVLILRSIRPNVPEAQGPETQGKGEESSFPTPQRILFGTSPIVNLSSPGAVVQIERLDLAGPALVFKVNHYLDLAEAHIELPAGGLYRAESEGRAVVFRIDSSAHPGRGPIISRLIHF
jgi:hypothetical protein